MIKPLHLFVAGCYLFGVDCKFIALDPLSSSLFIYQEIRWSSYVLSNIFQGFDESLRMQQKSCRLSPSEGSHKDHLTTTKSWREHHDVSSGSLLAVKPKNNDIIPGAAKDSTTRVLHLTRGPLETLEDIKEFAELCYNCVTSPLENVHIVIR